MAKLQIDINAIVKKLSYTKTEITNLLSGKADTDHEHGDLYYTESEIDTQMNGKVDKETGKGLSTNDYTTAEKTKLANLENTTVDAALSSSSENPVQNKAVQSALDGKVDKVTGKGLSTEDYTSAEKTKLAGLENTTVDSTLSSSSENPVQNKVVNTALGNKVDKVSGKGLSTNDYTTAEKEKLAGLSNTTVDATLSDNSENPVQNKVVKSALDNKANSTHNHSINDVTDLQTTLNGKAASNHTHAASEVTDTSAYSNIGTSANATQATINSNIDSKLGSLLSIKFFMFESTRPTASAETMDKLYFIPAEDAKTENAYDIFATVKNGNTYEWEQIDTVNIDFDGYMRNPTWNADTGVLEFEY